MKRQIYLLFLFQIITYSKGICQDTSDPISNSILVLIKTVDPLFENSYIKSGDGQDQKYTEFLISGIRSAPVEIKQSKAHSSFAMVLASLSKEDAKAFGLKTGKDEEIRKAYQSFLYLGDIPISSDEEKLQIYLHAIKSVAFHLKVKEIPVYEEMEQVIDYVEDELLKNVESLPKDQANRINQIQLHFLFSIALENLSKFLSLGILEEERNPAFDRLAMNRAKALPVAKNVGELSKLINSLSKEECSELDRKMVLLIADYIDLTKNLLEKVIKN
jgi:hypothetical protein